MENIEQKVIYIARKEVGYLEKKNNDLRYLYEKTQNAGSANYQKYSYDLRKAYPDKKIYFPAAWCDYFVDWCFLQAYGVSNLNSLIGGVEGYTPSSAELYKKHVGAWIENPALFKPGDQIFFKNSSRICHTGLIIDVIPSSQTIVTIEGNTGSGDDIVIPNGGCVAQKFYKFNNTRIAGAGRPAYNKLNKMKFTPHWIHIESTGTWYYRIAENTNAHDWTLINGHWYYFNKSGEMLKGLQKINGGNFYFMTFADNPDLEGSCCKTKESGELVEWYVA